MILVTTGTQMFGFDRLIMAADKLASSLSEEVFIQTGHSGYEPKHCRFSKFVQKQEMDRLMDEAWLVITHGGTGSIIDALNKGKKVIAVPRLSSFKEHVDDHQKEIIDEFERQGLLIGVRNINDLPDAVERARNFTPGRYIGNRDAVIEEIERILKREVKF